MAKKKGITKEIKKKVRQYARFISSKGIPVNRVVVFGSYAKGKAVEDSDIDLCLVSSKFGRDPVSELQFLLKQTRYIDDRIEPIPISVKEYKETASPLIFEIRKHGKEIRVR